MSVLREIARSALIAIACVTNALGKTFDDFTSKILDLAEEIEARNAGAVK